MATDHNLTHSQIFPMELMDFRSDVHHVRQVFRNRGVLGALSVDASLDSLRNAA